MKDKDSHGSHGGNRGSGDSRKDDPNARAGMLDTKVGQMKKDDPADVARTGWEAMLKGEQSVVHGLMNQAQVLAAGVLPEAVTAELHRQQAEPGSGKR